MSLFNKATRKKVWLKLGMMGPSGSGKTYSALLLAEGLAEGGRIAGVDTENGSMSLYSNLTDFDVLQLTPPFYTKKAIEAIHAAVAGGYKVLIIDSQTHFWKQILEEKEQLDQRGGNSFTNWGKIKPKYDELKETILHAPIHIICCMRGKDEYVLEKNKSGKDSPRKVGMGAIAEPGAEFEYTTVFDIDMSHNVTASKDRTSMFSDEIFKITPETGKRFLDWMANADPMEEKKVEPVSFASGVPVDGELQAKIYLKGIGFDRAELTKLMEYAAEESTSWVNVAQEAKKDGVSSVTEFWLCVREGISSGNNDQ